MNKQKAAEQYSGPGADYLKLPLKELLAIPEAQALLQQHFPDLIQNPDFKKVLEEASLTQVTGFAPGTFTPERLAAFAAELAQKITP